MNISVFAVLTNDDPFDFEGRFILESGDELTDTIISEYVTRFNSTEEFAKYLLKYHWYLLSGCKFNSFIISVDLASKKKMGQRVPIYIGEKVPVYVLGEDVEMVTPAHLAPYINTVYILSIYTGELGIYKIEGNQLVQEKSINLIQLKAGNHSADQELPTEPIQN